MTALRIFMVSPIVLFVAYVLATLTGLKLDS